MKRCPSCGQTNQGDAAFCIHCGFGLSAVASEPTGSPERRWAGPPGAYLPEGTLIDGKYAVERVLGEGGMGVVYLARDVHTEMPVVVKSIRAELSDTPEFRSRTLAEGRALARIDHPNVVRLNAVVVEPRGLYLVMQYIDGEPLDRLIARWVEARTPMPLGPALSIFRMILRGVGAAHAEGLIHRDLKPANVLIRAKDGVAKVTDFGIAKGEEDAKAGRGLTQGIIGSLSYMAPEQVRGQRDLDKRVDIYALGILLFELLTGRMPFEAPSDYELMRMQAEAPLPSLSAYRSDLPPAVDAALQRACAKDRNQRFATTDAFLAALEGAETGAAPPPVFAPGNTVRANPVTEIATQPGVPPWAAQPVAGPATGAPAAWTASPGPVARTATGDGAAIPLKARPARHAGVWIGVGVGAIAIAAIGTVIYLGGSESPQKPGTATSSGPQVPSAGIAAATRPTATATATNVEPTARAAESPLNALAGHWKSSSNREYAAVVTGDTLQFRIQRASQHPRQGYEDGDVRFALAPMAGSPSQFAVVDYLRPTPPPGVEYDPQKSRETCIGTWSEINGKRLIARYDGGSALSLQLALVRTGAEKFKTQGNRVVACADIGSAPAQVIESQLTRLP